MRRRWVQTLHHLCLSLRWFLHPRAAAKLYDFVLCGWNFFWIIMKMRCSSVEQASGWMRDLVDRSKHSDWILDNTVSELGLSHAHWPVSMVTSLMGVRGWVRKCSPNRCWLWGRKLYGVLFCDANNIRYCFSVFSMVVVSVCLVLVYYFTRIYCSLLECNPKQIRERNKMADSGYCAIVNDPGHQMGSLTHVAKWADSK